MKNFAILVLLSFLIISGCPRNTGTTADGGLCSNNSQCVSGYCADGRRCAPENFTGVRGDYCHHDDHCASRRCGCDLGQRGANSFCNNWQSGGSGTCLAKRGNGHDCMNNENCLTNYCADVGRITPLDWWTTPALFGRGGRCAPDGNGVTGAYCHHGNHCLTGTCSCPDGVNRTGFCPNWENFSMNVPDTISGTPNTANINVQMRRGAFMCL